jgi:hypothetical protein
VNPRWQVSFSGLLTPDAKAELAQYGIFLVGQQVGLAARPCNEHVVWVRAATAEEALTTVRGALALHGEFSAFTAEPVNYTMYLGFLESEHEALESVTHEAGEEDPRVSMVIVSEPSKGSAELLLEIPAADRDDAIAQAKALYAELRAHAGLPPAEALYGFLGPTGYFPTTPIIEPPRYAQLAQDARDLFDAGSHDYAVIAAQTSCEVLVYEAITDILAALQDAPGADFARGWFKKYGQPPSLRDQRLQQLWTSLTADAIQGHDWWDAYSKHVVRRHGVVHRGAQVTRAEAEESLSTTAQFRDHVLAIVIATLGLADA